MKKLRVAVAAALSLTVLAACSPEAEESPAPLASVSETESPSAEPSASPSPEESPSPAVTPATDLSAIQVSDTDVPEISFDAPWAIASTTSRVLRPSEGGQRLTADSVVTLNYVGVNGTTGEVFDSSYERGAPSVFSLSNVVAGFRLGLSGQTVGSRVLVGMPSSDGYPEGNQDGSIQPGDSLLFVIDIISANFEEVTGEPVAPVEGMPEVTEDDEGAPVATIDTEAEAPEELQVAPLIAGPGAEVTADSVIQVKYRSWVWDTGEPFEDAWAPQSGRLSGLIEGWRQGLEGQTAGSRVLLVVPPELAYPEGRTTSPALPPDQTLVYVIDILDVQNS